MTELTQVQHLSLRLHDTHLAGLAYGAPIPIVCLASAYQSYAGTHPMPAWRRGHGKRSGKEDIPASPVDGPGR